MYTGNRGRTAFFDTAGPSQNYSSLTPIDTQTLDLSVTRTNVASRDQPQALEQIRSHIRQAPLSAWLPLR